MNEIYKNLNITITGSGGYLGSKLIKKIDKNYKKIFFLKSYKNIILDKSNSIFDIHAWEKSILNSDIVFHLASNNSLDYAEKFKKEHLKETIDPIYYIIKSAKNFKKKIKVIYTSTATVYGLTENIPVNEMHNINPITNYDLHKSLAEKKLISAYKKGIIDLVILRLSNVFGPSIFNSTSSNRGIINLVTYNAILKKEINIYGHGNYLRDYIYIDDVIDAILIAGANKFENNFLFNICSNNGLTIKEAFNKISQIVEQKIKKKINVNHLEWPKFSFRIDKRNFVGSNQLFKKTTNWKTKNSFENGVKKLVNDILK